METLAEIVEKPPERAPETFEVIVIYNGIKKPLKVDREESMKSVLDRATAQFPPIPNPHTLALYTEGENGHELPITGTVEEARIKPGEKLALRPSAVRGG